MQKTSRGVFIEHSHVSREIWSGTDIIRCSWNLITAAEYLAAIKPEAVKTREVCVDCGHAKQDGKSCWCDKHSIDVAYNKPQCHDWISKPEQVKEINPLNLDLDYEDFRTAQKVNEIIEWLKARDK